MSLGLVEIYELSQDLCGPEFFEILEANDVHPGDIEELLGNETMCQYERWLYAEIK